MTLQAPLIATQSHQSLCTLLTLSYAQILSYHTPLIFIQSRQSQHNRFINIFEKLWYAYEASHFAHCLDTCYAKPDFVTTDPSHCNTVTPVTLYTANTK